jgi:lactose/L-arabinose transport system permease protein
MTAATITRSRGAERRGSGAPEPGPLGDGSSRASRRFAARMQRPGMWFALPAAALMAIFFAYPLVVSLLQSFFRTTGGETTFVGFEQYARLFRDPLVLKSLGNASLILVVQVPIMIALAVGLAYLLNQAWLRFRSGFRLITFLPAITTLVAYSVVFRVMMATDGGVLNQILGVFGVGPIDWLNNEWWARVALIAAITWRWTGYNMVIILAGLQAIPGELYEAARIDGAGRWQTFWHIVVPQLRPVLIFTIVTSTIGALQLFDENYILTGGGPNNATLTPVLYLYKVGFQQFDFGYANAIAWLLVVLTAIIALVQFRVMREKS